MGKRHKKSKAGKQEADVSMPRPLRKEILEMVNVLLEKCSNPFGDKGKEWMEYLEVYGLVEKLRKKQSNYVMSHPDREKCFPAFMTWLEENGVDTNAVSIEKYDVTGYGLKANKPIETSELFLSIPRKVMITTETAKSSVLAPLIKSDKLLQAVPSVSLALHLLCETYNPDSFWMPYIKILPERYNTPLYFTPEEMQLMRGSPAFSEAINQYRSIARQYAYFFRFFQSNDDTQKIPVRNMCFDDYRWAVSTVMTRQNQIPNRRGEMAVISLIPLWDMCNHTNGHVTTDFELKSDCSKCYALRKFEQGEQVFIFYGDRSNAEFLVHNGFIYPENEYDKLNIKLGISKNDTLFEMKRQLLTRLSLLPSRTFSLHAGQDPVDSSTLAYLRVFNMDYNELSARLSGQKAKQLVNQLRDFGIFVSADNEKKVWSFLETRAELLLQAYPTTTEHDETLLTEKSSSLSECSKLVLQLIIGEKNILKYTIQFAQDLRKEVDELVHQHLEQLAVGVKDLKLDTKQAAITEGKEDVDDLGELLRSDTPEMVEQCLVTSEVKTSEVNTAAISSETQHAVNQGQVPPTPEQPVCGEEVTSAVEQSDIVTKTSSEQSA